MNKEIMEMIARLTATEEAGVSGKEINLLFEEVKAKKTYEAVTFTDEINEKKQEIEDKILAMGATKIFNNFYFPTTDGQAIKVHVSRSIGYSVKDLKHCDYYFTIPDFNLAVQYYKTYKKYISTRRIKALKDKLRKTMAALHELSDIIEDIPENSED